MTVANAPSIIKDPVPIGIDAQLNFVVYSDRLLKTVKSLSGVTLTGQVKDPDGTWYDYSGTVDVAASGTAHITLTNAQHTTAGTAELRLLADGELCYPRYQFDFIEEAA